MSNNNSTPSFLNYFTRFIKVVAYNAVILNLFATAYHLAIFCYTCVPLSSIGNVFIEINLKMTILFNVMVASVFLAQADLCGEPPSLLHIGSRESSK